MNKFYLYKELLEKYYEVIKNSWQTRDKSRQKQWRSELEFLPATLEM